MLLKGIAWEKKTRIKQAAAFSLDNFKRTIRGIDVSTPTGLRNRVLLILGFTGPFRHSELGVLNIEDLAFDEEGLVVSLDKSKTNQLGQAEEKAIFYSPDPQLCPIRSLQAWRRLLNRTEGYVFVSLRKNQWLTTRRMTTKYINLITQQYLSSGYTAHLLRASFISLKMQWIRCINPKQLIHRIKRRISPYASQKCHPTSQCTRQFALMLVIT
ncbi:hypothetical protein [Hymenobacter negativus]|uniref:Tyr recombinase domain-containing protein n=1 Tax=Hymenobacter negativus TaxID=2795026 RepID=A0ABS3QNT5_9BACT|nr:hypothetical protein [Hymenobacter negativus]MBO2012950.1 hypothetical protein [Hymenobacter negativus]